MSMQDIVSDCVNRINNKLKVGHESAVVNHSGLVENVLKILKEEGFIKDFSVFLDNNRSFVNVFLKYKSGQPTIKSLKRISSPGKRVYKKADSLKKLRGGLGISILSTSKGVITDHQARKLNQGGEVVCEVY